MPRCVTGVLILLVLGLSLLRIAPTAIGIANVYIFPKVVSAEPGGTFVIEARISGAKDVFGWEFKLEWNASLLECTGFAEGGFLKGIEQNPTFFANKTYQDQVGNDSMYLACTRLGYVSGVDGSGTLAKVTFRADAKGETSLHLFNTNLADSRPTPFPIEHTTTDGLFSNIAGFPIARFTYVPSFARINETIVFDATTSSDPDGTVEQYFWDFGDGSNYSAPDPLADHAYREGGKHAVTLRVVDNEGWNGTLTQDVRVRFTHDIAIISVALSEITATAGDAVTITARVANYGTETATFNVRVYYGTSDADLAEVASAQTVSNLGMAQNATLTYKWNTAQAAPGEYRIKAVADTLTGETETADNSKWGSEINLKEAPAFPWTLVIGVAAILAVVVIAGLFLLRRRGKSAPAPPV